MRLRPMKWTKWTGVLLLTISASITQAQVTGGRFAMEFLRLSNSPHISALGGINIVNPERDIALALQNPSLMRPGLHNVIGLNYNGYYAGSSIANLQYGYHVPKLNTSFLLGVQYLNYGNFVQTDVVGREIGTFRATDFALTAGASRQYGKNWRYGASLKIARSVLFDKKALAILGDVGITYNDTASLWTFAAVAKNMGVMTEKYNKDAASGEPLPFDLQLGVSKRFAHIPLRLMATVHHLYEWDIRYDNPDDAQVSNLFNNQATDTKEKTYFADKLFRHFIFAAELTFAKRVTVTAGYNHLRRSELVITEKTGAAGFSFGLGLDLNKFQVHYGRSYYHVAGPYNEIGINMFLNKLMGIGKLGEKAHWNATYTDWEQPEG